MYNKIYNNKGQLIEITNNKGYRQTLEYDDFGKLIKMKYHHLNKEFTYEYDEYNNIIGEYVETKEYKRYINEITGEVKTYYLNEAGEIINTTAEEVEL